MTWTLILITALAAATRPPGESAVSQALMSRLAHGLGSARAGQWVSYELRGGPGRSAFWRMAVVAEEKDAVWVEMELAEHPAFKSPLLQMKLLVSRREGLRGTAGIRRIVIAAGLSKPQEVPPEALSRWTSAGGSPAPPPRPDTHIEVGAPFKLMTFAGTVMAQPVVTRAQGTVVERVFLSRDVPLLHLAGLELPSAGHALVLRDFGADAKPRVQMTDRPKSPTEVDGRAPVLGSAGGGR